MPVMVWKLCVLEVVKVWRLSLSAYNLGFSKALRYSCSAFGKRSIESIENFSVEFFFYCSNQLLFLLEVIVSSWPRNPTSGGSAIFFFCVGRGLITLGPKYS